MRRAEREAAWAIPSPVRAVEDMEHRLHTALHALDARDELLRRILPAFENDQRRAEAEGLEHQDSWALLDEIRAILGETP